MRYAVSFHDGSVCMAEGRDGFDACANAEAQWCASVSHYEIPHMPVLVRQRYESPLAWLLAKLFVEKAAH